MAFGYDGSVRIKADLNHSDFDRGLSAMTAKLGAFGSTLKKITGTMLLGRGSSSMTAQVNKLGGAFKKLGGMVAMAFGTAALVKFGKESINLASDITEVQNVIDVTFGRGAKQIEEFAQSAAEAYGLSELAAKQYTGTMGAMLKSSGLATSAAQEMSMALTGLAGDVASFYNLDTDTAFEKIRSGISGETEPLKQLGINMSVANLEAYALSKGITKSYNAMSQAEQVLLRYNYLLSVTTDAQGDFARTSGSFANQIRILQLNFDQLRIAVGNALIPIAQAVLPSINAIIAGLTKLAKVFAQVTALLFGKSPEVKTTSGIAASAGAAADATDKLAESAAGAGSAAKQAEKDMKGVLASFDELNILASNAAKGVGSAGGNLGNIGSDLDIPGFEAETGGELFSDTKISPKLLKEIEELKDGLSRIWEVFKKSWEANGPKVVEAAKRALTSIYELLKSIGTAFTEAWTGGSGLEFLNAVYALLETVLNIIADIADAWKAAFDNEGVEFFESVLFRLTAMLELINSIGVAFREVWNNGTGVEICETILRILTDINNIFGTIYTKIQEAWEANGNGVAIWQAVLDIVQDLLDCVNSMTSATLEWASSLNLEPLMSSFRGLLEAVEPLVDALTDGMSWAYENVLLPLASWVLEEAAPASINTFSSAIEALTALLNPLIDGFKGFWNAIQPIVKWIEDQAIVVINRWGETFTELAQVIDEHGTEIKNVMEGLGEAINTLWGIIEPTFTNIQKLTGTVFGFFKGTILDSVGVALERLNALLDFINGVFSGDWEKAWSGISRFFISIWEGLTLPVKNAVNLIIGLAEGLVNSVINALNALIRGINSFLSIKIPDNPLTGAVSFGIQIPPISNIKLPKLANGAVIPPNQQFAAVLGDQRSGKNLELPEGLLRRAIREEVSGMIGGTDVNISFNGSLSELARVLQPAIKVEERRRGTQLAQ